PHANRISEIDRLVDPGDFRTIQRRSRRNREPIRAGSDGLVRQITSTMVIDVQDAGTAYRPGDSDHPSTELLLGPRRDGGSSCPQSRGLYCLSTRQWADIHFCAAPRRFPWRVFCGCLLVARDELLPVLSATADDGCQLDTSWSRDSDVPDDPCPNGPE